MKLQSRPSGACVQRTKKQGRERLVRISQSVSLRVGHPEKVQCNFTSRLVATMTPGCKGFSYPQVSQEQLSIIFQCWSSVCSNIFVWGESTASYRIALKDSVMPIPDIDVSQNNFAGTLDNMFWQFWRLVEPFLTSKRVIYTRNKYMKIQRCQLQPT